MKGKIGLVVGLGVGYVLGTRAGRERYEQIKKQWLKVWHLDPVQTQVTRVQEFAKAQAAAVPQALWNAGVKVVKAATADGSAQERVDAAVAAGRTSAHDVAETVKDATEEAEKAAAEKRAAEKAAAEVAAPAKKAAKPSSSKNAAKPASRNGS
ncbi:hypothetical protein [uncultured Microbacterium sp.]|uniref:hypothetical protein n=1 Tax=uncultured Microbacterium sp. TaxID=191216 RepID=UPI0025E6CA4D|nr:hypothetical protein [uncultured Microbacterium sp.]